MIILLSWVLLLSLYIKGFHGQLVSHLDARIKLLGHSINLRLCILGLLNCSLNSFLILLNLTLGFPLSLIKLSKALYVIIQLDSGLIQFFIFINGLTLPLIFPHQQCGIPGLIRSTEGEVGSTYLIQVARNNI